jgi:hypothetical protein
MENFSRENIVGTSCGNVYKGVLADGSLISMNNFKNFSLDGDLEFVFNVEISRWAP